MATDSSIDKPCSECAFPSPDGDSINSVDEEGTTSLIRAASKGHRECLEVLIRSGADIHAADNEGNTALILAAYRGQRECLEVLIRSGADVNAADNEGNTALMQVIEYIPMDQDHDHELEPDEEEEFRARNGDICLKILLEAGANVNAANKEGTTALITTGLIGQRNTLKLLLEAGAHVNALDHEGKSPLNKAATNGNADCIQDLLDAGSDLNKANKDGDVLRTVADWGWFTPLKIFLEAGADVNACDENGDTALLTAVSIGRDEFADLLIQHGADVNACYKETHTPLIYATSGHKYLLTKMLLSAGADVNLVGNPLAEAACFRFDHESIFKNGINCLKLLLKSGAHVNKYDQENHNALGRHITKSIVVLKDVSMLLYAAGETLHPDLLYNESVQRQAEPPECLKAIASSLSLKHLCREAVREYLKQTHPHQHLFPLVPLLELPKTLHGYLLYYISLNIDEEDAQ